MLFSWLIVHCQFFKAFLINLYFVCLFQDPRSVRQPAESQLQGNRPSPHLHQRHHPGSAQHQDGGPPVHGWLLHQHEMVGNHIVTQSSCTSVPRYDRRLLFKDLNDNSILNGVNTEELLTLWTPELQFLNALGLYLDIYHVMLILFYWQDPSRPRWTTWMCAPSCTSLTPPTTTSRRVWSVRNWYIFHFKFALLMTFLQIINLMLPTTRSIFSENIIKNFLVNLTCSFTPSIPRWQSQAALPVSQWTSCRCATWSSPWRATPGSTWCSRWTGLVLTTQVYWAGGLLSFKYWLK